ncbi:MAG: hypothetical protein ABI540_03090 [Spartobacteria bacterium]
MLERADIRRAVGVAHVLEIDRAIEVSRDRLAIILRGDGTLLSMTSSRDPAASAVGRRLGDDFLAHHFTLRIETLHDGASGLLCYLYSPRTLPARRVRASFSSREI